MGDVDRIRWLHLTDAEIARLRLAVASACTACPEIVAAYHYGSSARRQPARDIDIGLVVDRAARSTFAAESLGDCIAAAAGCSPGDLDVRIVNDADSVFLGNLMREGVCCYERDEDARVAFEVRAMNSWLDFQPAWDRLRRAVRGGWSRG